MPSYRPTVAYTPAEHSSAAIMIGVGTAPRCCMTSAKSISSMRWTSTHAAMPAIDSHTTAETA